MSERVVVYTDGAYSVDPCIGGWAYLIIYGGGVEKGSGGKEGRSTSNAMEVRALCEAMENCNKLGIRDIEVCTDSSYVINYFQDIEDWNKNNWKKKNGRDIKNKSYWKRVHRMIKGGMSVEFDKVKSHSGDKYNETVDSLARGAIEDVRTRKDC